MPEAYFTTRDGHWFIGTDYARGPWDADSCHAGPPTALIVRALEHLAPHQRLHRITVELMRPIPIRGFQVQAEVRRPGRSVTLSEAEIFDEDRVYVRAFGLHTRTITDFSTATAPSQPPDFAAAVAGDFPIRDAHHDQTGFSSSVEVRYNVDEGGAGTGGPTTVWLRPKIPILADEAPSPFQRICPLADSGNGISYNEYLDRVAFVNPDLTVALHRDPVGEWHAARARSHWQPDGTGLADAELFDVEGSVGRALQTVLLEPRA
jgi:hypothetical protein